MRAGIRRAAGVVATARPLAGPGGVLGAVWGGVRRACCLLGVWRCRTAWRLLALATVAGVVTALAGVSPGVASASVAAHRPLQPDARSVRGGGLTLARAPAGLRAAVRRTFRSPAAGAGSAFQQAELADPGGVADDYFGWSVAISGSTAVIGAPGYNSTTGAAYVFVRSGTTWSQQAGLTDPGGAQGDEFGASVAVSGSTAVVGAPGSNSTTGVAYVFVRSGTTWSQQAGLTAAGGAEGDDFGWSVATTGSRAVVGAWGSNSDAGAAYLFVRSGTAWSQEAGLTDPGGVADDYFGYSVAISGSTAVIGAWGSNSDTGGAYVFVSSGSTWSEQAELTAADGAAGDDFGDSVAIAGSTAVVGAPFHNSDAGAAYVFTQSGSTWSQQAELTAADGAPGDDFGASVAIAGSSAVVGAYGSNSSAGAAYVFVRSGGSWSPQAGLSAADGAAGGDFGHSVAISGSTAMVGAYGSNSSAGAAYVFTLPSQQAELTASAFADEFGYSVAISGSTAVVGARVKSPGGYESAAAYIFVSSGSTWSEQARLTNPGCGGLFGWSVAISGATVVVGAPGGAACVFVRSGSSWSEQATLDDPGGAASDGFGDSVAISGFRVVVGAPGSNSSTGAAYVFVRSGSTWSQQVELTAADGAAGDQFGSSVAVNGLTAVVGAPDKNSNTGAADVFTRIGSTWVQLPQLTAPGGAAGDYFGSSVAISGSTWVVGAPGSNSGTGAAYVFVRSGTSWSRQAQLTAADGAAGDDFGSSVAISGSTAVVGADGSNSQAGAAYVFTGPGGTWSQQAKLTAADGAANDQFGYSVAIAKSTAVVGAISTTGLTGAAYVFANV
jgi:hypothetical protein